MLLCETLCCGSSLLNRMHLIKPVPESKLDTPPNVIQKIQPTIVLIYETEYLLNFVSLILRANPIQRNATCGMYLQCQRQLFKPWLTLTLYLQTIRVLSNSTSLILNSHHFTILLPCLGVELINARLRREKDQLNTQLNQKDM